MNIASRPPDTTMRVPTFSSKCLISARIYHGPHGFRGHSLRSLFGFCEDHILCRDTGFGCRNFAHVFDPKSYLSARRDLVEAELAKLGKLKALVHGDTGFAPGKLAEAMNYSLLAGGSGCDRSWRWLAAKRWASRHHGAALWLCGSR